MFEDLFLLRRLAPRAFRGARFLAWMLFWMTFFVLSLGIVIGLVSDDGSAKNSAPVTSHERRAR